MANLKLIGIGHIHLRLGSDIPTPKFLRQLLYHPIILKVIREIVLPQQRSLLPLYTLLQLVGQGPCLNQIGLAQNAHCRGEPHIGTPKLNVSTTRSVRNAVK